jgi:hypothetical protein
MPVDQGRHWAIGYCRAASAKMHELLMHDPVWRMPGWVSADLAGVSFKVNVCAQTVRDDGAVLKRLLLLREVPRFLGESFEAVTSYHLSVIQSDGSQPVSLKSFVDLVEIVANDLFLSGRGLASVWLASVL